MRIIRDSPPELARLFPGAYASSKSTRFPARWRKLAVHEPNTPAPTTTTSNFALGVMTRVCLSLESLLHQFVHAQSRNTRRTPRLHQGLNIFRQHIALNIHRIARYEPLDIRLLIRKRNDRKIRDAISPVRHRQTNSINRNRSFLRHITPKILGYAHRKPPTLAFAHKPRHAPHRVHVPLHKMSAEAIARRQRPL